MTDADIIIIGAGASGLMAARELSRAGKNVIVLEARDRLGGRIYTLKDEFSMQAEGGVEFIHGRLPVTMGLLKEAGLQSVPLEGEMWRFRNGKLEQDENFMEDGDLLMKTLNKLKSDMTVAAFLDQYFPDAKYAALKDSVTGLVEGYDAADTQTASAFMLRNELADEGQWEQSRINGGYEKLIRFLEHECKTAGCSIRLSSVVKEIHWKKNSIEIVTDNERYHAAKGIITVPLGVLQMEPGSLGAISFSPALPEKQAAARTIGFGAVIKILLEFTTPFWKESREPQSGKGLKNLGWLFSDAPVPTWWTQLPVENALLTGWLAGPKAQEKKDSTEEIILEEALNSLCHLFNTSNNQLKSILAKWRIINWAADPFARGAYSFTTVGSAEAKNLLSQPVENTLFFAGEAFHEETGTVEIALASGMVVAKEILAS